MTNIYLQKSSYFVAWLLFISGVKLLFSTTAHPLAGAGEKMPFLCIGNEDQVKQWSSCSVAFEPPTPQQCVQQQWCAAPRVLEPREPPVGAGFTGWFWICWTWASESSGDPPLHVAANDSGSSFSLPSAPCGMWCVPLRLSCGGRWNEEEIWKLAGRKSSNILKKRGYLQLQAPLNRETKSRDGTKQIFYISAEVLDYL